MTDVLMPKATAVWLIENTALSFKQIAEFCGLYELEVKGMADGDVAQGVRGADPIGNGQLTRDDIEACEKNPELSLTQRKSAHEDLLARGRTRKGARYTPLSRRQERPNAIAWLVKNHPELTDGQIGKLIGTTKTTIEAVRSRTHWNAANIVGQDPVALGLCSQIELDAVVRKAAAKRRAQMPEGELEDEGDTLNAPAPPAAEEAPAEEALDPSGGDLDAESVFAKLGGASHEKPDDERG